MRLSSIRGSPWVLNVVGLLKNHVNRDQEDQNTPLQVSNPPREIKMALTEAVEQVDIHLYLYS